MMSLYRIAVCAILCLVLVACDHPLNIMGEGDITSASNTRNCTLEDYRVGAINCTKNTVVGAYQETYTATPRDGWIFTGWQGCPSIVNGSCVLTIPAETVAQFWGQAAPPLTATFSQGNGILVADVRSTGFSDTYRANQAYRQVVDAFLVEIGGVIKEIESEIKWPSNIPVVFSGCGQKGAFFGARTDVYAQILKGVPDPALVFGPNVTGNVLVMCHELTEAALKTFLLDASTLQNLKIIFKTETDDELAVAALATALIFELQILFHELGHGFDFLLLNQTVNNSIKQQNFTIPIPNQCGEANCDTIAEDFADWISALVLVEVLEQQIEDNSADAGQFVKAWAVALDSWAAILGSGGGAAHGFTVARQVNMLCYTYGALPALRTADRIELNSYLANKLATAGLNDVACETIYTRNATSTDTLLGAYIK